jgi:WD40 repeat protein
MTASLDIDHPWPGPDSFRARDAAFFRGRDTEIKQLLPLVRRARSVVVFGASGLGKTSLINAGVVPRLAADEYFAVPIRISYVAGAPSVSEQLQTEIMRSRSGPGMPTPRPNRTAWELLHLRDEPIEGAQPLLIFDQFEELFTIGTGTPQAAQLLEELKALIEGAPPASVRERLEQFPDEARALAFQRKDHRVLISIREDFLYGLESLRTQLPSIIHNRYRIGPLGGAMALEVVLQRPTARPDAAGGERVASAPVVESDVAELIVRTVASSVPDHRPLDTLEVEPALLSILCTELARRRAPGTPITRELVTGSRTEIIASFYDRALQGAPEAVRVYIEDELVTATGYRTSTVVAEALAVPGFTSEVLSDLVNKRLLRVIERPNGKWLELTHDILTQIAARSRKLRQARQREQEERAARAERERVEQVARAARDRSRRNRALTVLGGLLLTLGVLGNLYRAERSSHRAEVSQRRAANARYEAELRSRRAADEAKHALRRQFIDASLREERYPEAMAQLAAAVTEEPDAVWAPALVGDLLLRRGWPLPASPVFPDGPFTSLDCNRSSTRCAAAYRDGRVLVRGDLSLDLTTDQKGYGGLSMSNDGGRLVFVPEQPGTAVQWTLGATTERFGFPLTATRDEWGASSDGRVVVLPTDDGLDVWQLGTPARSTPRNIRRHLGHAPFALSRDGTWLAYAYLGVRESIALADVAGVKTLPLSVSGAVTLLRIDPGSKVVLAAASDGTLLRWSIPDGRVLAPLKASRPINSIDFDATGDHMVLALEGGGVELWTKPWLAPRVLMPSSHGVMGVSFAPDDRWLAVATRDGVVSTWSSSGDALGEPVRLDALAFASALNGHGLLGVSLGGTSTRWILPTPRAPLQYDLGEPVRTARFGSEDAVFAYGDSRWLEQAGDERKLAPLYRSFYYTFVSRDRRHVATAYAGGLYLRDGMPSSKYADGADKLLDRATMDSVMFSADGKRLAAVGGGKGYLFDVAAGQPIGKPIDDVSGAWLNDDGTILATKRRDVGLTLWTCASDGSLRKLADIDALVVSSVAFNRASDALVLASENQARIWSLRDRHFTGRAVAHDGPITDVAFSPDGRWIATASEDKRARIWEAASGLPASDWFKHDGSVTAAAFSPSGRKLLTASSDRHVRVWDLAGSADATGQDRLWLARLAELLSGMRIDPGTNEAVPAPKAVDALESLRREIERGCPGATSDPPGCASSTNRLLRAVLGKRGVDRWSPVTL